MSEVPNLVDTDIKDYLKAGEYDSLLKEIKKKADSDGFTNELLADIVSVKIYFKKKVENKINDIGNNSVLNEIDTKVGQNETIKTTFLEEYFFIIFKAIIFIVVFVFIYYYWFNKKNDSFQINESSAI